MPAQRELHVTSPLLHGADVEQLQQKLSDLGYRPGPVDGEYGPATFQAVERFQGRERLRVDGIVGPQTWARLDADAKKPAPPVGAPHPKPAAKPVVHRPVVHGDDIGLLALTWSVKHIGEHESPAASNLQPFGPMLGMPNGVPWCDEFVSCGLWFGAGVVQCKGFHAPGVYARGCTYVPTTEAWLRLTNQWVGRSYPPGDGWVPCFNWDGGVPDHIGFSATEETLLRLVPTALGVAIRDFGRLGHGDFWSVEGNTSAGNNSNGGQVQLRKRNLTLVDGFGHLRRAA